jgi:hypothetical protein
MVTDSLTASNPWPSLRNGLCALLPGPTLILPGTPDLVKTSVSSFTEPDTTQNLIHAEGVRWHSRGLIGTLSESGTAE